MKKLDVNKNGYKIFPQNFFKLKKSFLNEFEDVYKEKSSNLIVNTATINDLSSIYKYAEIKECLMKL